MPDNANDTQAVSGFEAVISYWHEHPRCTVRDADAGTCGRDAAWRWRFHGCSSGVMCAHHLLDWLRRLAKVEWPDRCEVCGCVFASQGDACTVVAL